MNLKVNREMRPSNDNSDSFYITERWFNIRIYGISTGPQLIVLFDFSFVHLILNLEGMIVLVGRIGTVYLSIL